MKLFILVMAMFTFSRTVMATDFSSGGYTVVCKAKHQKTTLDGKVISKSVLDFQKQGEDATNNYWIAHAENIQLEIQENKSVFFFKPVITWDNGLQMSSTGYFDSTGKIAVYAKTKTADAEYVTADIRCCKNCSFSDWK